MPDSITLELTQQDWDAAIEANSVSTSRCLVAKAINRVLSKECRVGYDCANIYDGGKMVESYNLSSNAEAIIKNFDNATYLRMDGKPFNVVLGTITMTKQLKE